MLISCLSTSLENPTKIHVYRNVCLKMEIHCTEPVFRNRNRTFLITISSSTHMNLLGQKISNNCRQGWKQGRQKDTHIPNINSDVEEMQSVIQCCRSNHETWRVSERIFYFFPRHARVERKIELLSHVFKADNVTRMLQHF